MSERRPRTALPRRGTTTRSRGPTGYSTGRSGSSSFGGSNTTNAPQRTNSGGFLGTVSGLFSSVWKVGSGLFSASDKLNDDSDRRHTPSIKDETESMDVSEESVADDLDTGSLTGWTQESGYSESQASSRTPSVPPSRDPLSRRSVADNAPRPPRFQNSSDVGNLIMNKSSPTRLQLAAQSKQHSKARSATSADSEEQYEGFSNKVRAPHSAFGLRMGPRFLKGPGNGVSYVVDEQNPRKRRLVSGAGDLSDEELARPMPKRRAMTDASNGSDDTHQYGSATHIPRTPRDARSRTAVDEDGHGQYPSSVPAKRILQSIVNTNRRLAAPALSTDSPAGLPSSSMSTPSTAPAWATPARPVNSSSVSTSAVATDTPSSKKRRRLDLDLPPSTTLLESAATWSQRKKQRIGKVALTSTLVASPATGLFSSPSTLSSTSATSTTTAPSSPPSTYAPPANKKSKASETPSVVASTEHKDAAKETPRQPPIFGAGALPSNPKYSAGARGTSSSGPAFSAPLPKATGFGFVPPSSATSDPKKPEGMSDAEWEEVKPKPVNKATAAFLSGSASTKPTASATPSFGTPKPSSSSDVNAKPIAPVMPSSSASAKPTASTTPLFGAPKPSSAVTSDSEKPAGMSDAEWEEVKPKPVNKATAAFLSGGASAKPTAPVTPLFGPPKTPTVITSDSEKPAGMSDAEWEEVKPKPVNKATAAFLSGGASAKPTTPVTPSFGTPSSGVSAKPIPSSNLAFGPPKPPAVITSDSEKPAGMSDAEWEEVRPKPVNKATAAFLSGGASAKPTTPVTPSFGGVSAKPTPSANLAFGPPKPPTVITSDSEKPAGMSDAEWEEVKPKPVNKATAAFLSGASTKPAATTTTTTTASSSAIPSTSVASAEPKKPEGMSDAEWAEIKPKPVNAATARFMSGSSSSTNKSPGIAALESTKQTTEAATAPSSKPAETTTSADTAPSPSPKKTGFTFSGSSFGTLTKKTAATTSEESSSPTAAPKKTSFASFQPIATPATGENGNTVAAAAKSALSFASKDGDKSGKPAFSFSGSIGAKPTSSGPTMPLFGKKDEPTTATPKMPLFGKKEDAPTTDGAAAKLPLFGKKPDDTAAATPSTTTPSTAAAVTTSKTPMFGKKPDDTPATTTAPGGGFPKMAPFTTKFTASTPSTTTASASTTTSGFPAAASSGAGAPKFGGFASTSTSTPAESSLKRSTSSLTAPKTTTATPSLFGAASSAGTSTSTLSAFGTTAAPSGFNTSTSSTSMFASTPTSSSNASKGAGFAFGQAPSTSVAVDPLAAFKRAETSSPATQTSTWGSSEGFGSSNSATSGLFSGPAASAPSTGLFGSTSTPSSGFPSSGNSSGGGILGGNSTFASSGFSGGGFKGTGFNTAGSGFGSSTSSGFGSTPAAGGFGTTPASDGFGTSSGGGFGSSTGTGFGTSSAGGFGSSGFGGSSSPAPTGLFSAPTSSQPLFGAGTAPTTFGSSMPSGPLGGATPFSDAGATRVRTKAVRRPVRKA